MAIIDNKIVSLGGKKMSEPTRKQIKEAFKKTIERWEKIVKEPDYYYDSSCPLCEVFHPGDQSCTPNLCPIATYADSIICKNTPYTDFVQEKNSANALAELNFLRKVYIWWMEKESKKEWWTKVKEEKKEEWEDITDEINVQTHSGCMLIKHRGDTVAFNGDVTEGYPKVAEIILISSRPNDFKFTVRPHVFKILKKT